MARLGPNTVYSLPDFFLNDNFKICNSSFIARLYTAFSKFKFTRVVLFFYSASSSPTGQESMPTCQQGPLFNRSTLRCNNIESTYLGTRYKHPPGNKRIAFISYLEHIWHWAAWRLQQMLRSAKIFPDSPWHLYDCHAMTNRCKLFYCSNASHVNRGTAFIHFINI